jgi:hypothetical protein
MNTTTTQDGAQVRRIIAAVVLALSVGLGGGALVANTAMHSTTSDGGAVSGSGGAMKG